MNWVAFRYSRIFNCFPRMECIRINLLSFLERSLIPYNNNVMDRIDAESIGTCCV